MTNENQQIVERYMNAWSAADEAVLNELIDDGFSFNNPPPGITPDKAGTIEMAKQYSAAFKDMDMRLGPYVSEGDRVAVRFVAKGTHTGEFMGIAPTNNAITATGLGFVTLRDGKIVEDVTEFDALGLFMQLGSFPPMPEQTA